MKVINIVTLACINVIACAITAGSVIANNRVIACIAGTIMFVTAITLWVGYPRRRKNGT